MSTDLQDLEDARVGSSNIGEAQGAQAPETQPQRTLGKRKLEHEHPPTRKASTRLPSKSSICAQCSNLDLLGALRKARQIREREVVLFGTDLYFGIRIANVGHRFRQLPSTECALCSILFSSRIAPDKGHPGHTTSEDGDDIRLIGFLDRSGLLRFPFQFREHDSAYLAVVPSYFGSDRDSHSKLLKNHVCNQGAAILLQDEDHPAMFASREVPGGFDAKIVNTWMHHCKSNHSILCGGSKGSVVPGLRLIDCWKLSVTEAESNRPYVALSYVWNKLGHFDNTLRRTRNRLMLPARLSPAISDAIHVTKALGFHYLWVDKFCIDQDDPDTKHEQIKQMNTIYEGAGLTIVAAAGEDETRGLPGVGRTPREPQRSARFNGLSVTSTLQDPHALIRSSRWASRGWTFQEAVLSRRCLVFTDQQMYFECNSMNCFESLHSALDKLHVADGSRSLDGIRAGMFGKVDTSRGFWEGIPDEDNLPSAFHHYSSAIESYSFRDLSYDSDSLNAFQGIIEMYSKLQQPFNAIWGMPYPAQREKRVSYFNCALAWYHPMSCYGYSNPPRRRPEFPSWTWAGWSGKVRMQDWIRTGVESGIQSIRFGDGGYAEENLDSLDYTTLQVKCRVLRLLAKALPLSLVSRELTTQPTVRGIDGGTIWSLAPSEAQLLDFQGQRCQYPDRMHENQFVQDMMDEEHWQYIWVYSVSHVSFIMVLRLNDDNHTWERAGMFLSDLSALSMRSTMEDIEATWFNIV